MLNRNPLHVTQDEFEREITKSIKWAYRINKKLPEVIADMSDKLSEKRTRSIWKSLKNDPTCVKFVDDDQYINEIRVQHDSGMTVDEIYNDGFKTQSGVLFKPRDYGFTKYILTNENRMNLGKHKTKSEMVYDIIVRESTDTTYSPNMLYIAKKLIYGTELVGNKEVPKTNKYDNRQINKRLRDGGYTNRDLATHENHSEMSDIVETLFVVIKEYTKHSTDIHDIVYFLQKINEKSKTQSDAMINSFCQTRREKMQKLAEIDGVDGIMRVRGDARKKKREPVQTTTDDLPRKSLLNLTRTRSLMEIIITERYIKELDAIRMTPYSERSRQDNYRLAQYLRTAA